MKTGFWLLDGDMDDHLEKTLVAAEDSSIIESAELFLHGVCSVFAMALHDCTGYKIGYCFDEGCAMEIGDSYKALIHVYCLASHDGGNCHYVDIRGITDDEDAFFEPFEDFFLDMDEAIVEAEYVRQKLCEQMGEETYLKCYADTKCFIDQHTEYYLVNQ